MAKAIRHFYGKTTFGDAVERAQRADGVWFWREYGYNGYGMGWSKWAECEDSPVFEEYTVNQYTGERVKLSAPRMMWGFQPMAELQGPHRIRLPN